MQVMVMMAASWNVHHIMIWTASSVKPNHEARHDTTIAAVVMSV